MNGHWAGVLNTIGPDRFLIGGSFAVNGTSDPAAASSRGRAGNTFTVAYSATGVYTVTFPLELKLPAQPFSIVVTPQWDALANWFDVAVVGDSTLNGTNRQIVIQAHRSGTGNAPAAGTGARINFMLLASNNTGA